jgi:hypothetical protein
MDKRLNEHAEEMYAMYQSGRSLAEVARAFGKTRQSVWGLFRYRGWPRRPVQPLPFLTFNGVRYTMANTGYYRRTDGSRSLMHRDVWEFYNGPIQKGWDIHHIDEDRTNNAIENLECLPKAEHTRKYSPHNNQYTRGRKK